jgi:predicted phosphate transport protein (TIGR00153 family)
MLQWFHRLMPSDRQFFPLFERHAAVLVSAAGSLRQMLDGGSHVAEHCSAVMAREAEADEITHQVLMAVRSTFITPFDRSDIKDLITSMDDAADQMKKTAKSILLFEMTEFQPDMREMADAIVEGARLVERAVPLLARVSRNAGQLNEICVQITRIEGESDDIYERALKTLYAQSREEGAMAFIRGNVVYDHLEKAVDRLDDVANEIEAVVIEHV